MKKVLGLFLIPLCFAACTSSTPDTRATVAKDSVTAAPPVILPYTASYSSNFVPGKQADVLTVLNSYKTWETNDMKGLRATCGDSLEMVFSNGASIKGRTDSLMKIISKYRDSLSSVQITLIAWTSNHSVDKNEDWVNVWYKEVDTYKKGKVDSLYFEDDNLVKDGKIAWVSSHSQKFKK